MIDLHTHTLLSDGVLLPSELLRRYEVLGIKVLAFTDHVDSSNIDWVVPRIVEATRELQPHTKVKLIPGCELTHLPLKQFRPLAEQARKLGARFIVGHGETPAEPVRPGTNRAAILSGVDMLAHPGLITRADLLLAKKNKVSLEISSRVGHSLANGHVARMAGECGAQLVFSTDSHTPPDLCSMAEAKKILKCAGLSDSRLEQVFRNEAKWIKKFI